MPINFEGISTTKQREYYPNLIYQINERLRNGNVPMEQRAAILGSIIEESGGNPLVQSKTGAYQGLLQWGADRYRLTSNNRSTEMNNQTQYILNTIGNTTDGVSWTHGGKGSGYKTQKDAHDAFNSNDNTFADKFRAFSYGYVRPQGKEDSYQNRLKVGREVLNKMVIDEKLSKPKPKKWTPIPFDKSYVSSFKYDEGGSLDNPDWNNLSISDKAEMMKVAIANGITTLPEIRRAYNEFAKGGNMQNNSKLKQILNGIPIVKQDLKDISKNFSLNPKVLRDRFYKYFDPYSSYSNEGIKRAADLVIGGPDYAKRKFLNEEGILETPYIEGAQTPFDDAVWGTYLRIPTKERKYKKDLVESKFKPTKGESDEKYYTIPIDQRTKERLIKEGESLPFNHNANTKALFGYNMGTSTIGKGVDDNGEYISYYDKWDINPLHGDYVNNTLKKDHPTLSKIMPSSGEDVFEGITNPISFYDRIYLDDYYGVKSSVKPGDYFGGWLPEVVVTPNPLSKYGIFANGGYIPSDSIKKRIANWEGSSMKTNRSFEDEAKDFNRVVPAEVRNRLSQQQKDALYSYGYNVGMGRLKERVVPILTAYTEGNASKEDVQRAMWASRDNELRGLTTRRNAEREMFGGNYRTKFTGTGKLGIHIDPSEYTIPQNFFDDINAGISLPQMQMPNGMDTDPETLYKAPIIDETLFEKPVVPMEEITYNPQEDKMEGIRRLGNVLGMMGDDSVNNSLGILDYVRRIYS